MFNVLIVGGGNIGFRHFEGLLSAGLPLNIYVIDPDREALNRIKHKFHKAAVNHISCHPAESLTAIPDKIDLCIIATNSKVRLEAAGEVLKKSSVSYLILEKVLFQKEKDYDIMSKLLKDHHVLGCWVNCPLRTLPIYQELKKKITAKVNISVDYKHFGIGCNSIHQLDLLSYLTNSQDIIVTTDQLESVVGSKRKGYMEVTGTLKASTKQGAILTVAANSQSSEEYCITFDFGHERWTVFPLKETCKIDLFHTNTHYEKAIQYLKQSCLTSLFAKDILVSGVCLLPDYETSKQLHLALLAPLNDFFSKALGYEVEECPIT
ncbi:NAD(P)-dependent oxidoreductase [Metabacillus indicus]|uniref:NAD(P)-dependent oxidoreductase n=1 Tax=Metabacillus indicus TaxID=246786 RepID=UPI003CEE3B23